MTRPALGCLLAMCLSAWSCGGGGSSNPSTPTPTPVPPTQDVSFSGTVAAFGTASHSLAVTVPSGTLSATLTWADAAVDLDVYLTASSCAGYPPLDCTVLAKSVAESGVREQVTRAVKADERYLLWIDNLTQGKSADYTLAVSVR